MILLHAISNTVILQHVDIVLFCFINFSCTSTMIAAVLPPVIFTLKLHVCVLSSLVQQFSYFGCIWRQVIDHRNYGVFIYFTKIYIGS